MTTWLRSLVNAILGKVPGKTEPPGYSNPDDDRRGFQPPPRTAPRDPINGHSDASEQAQPQGAEIRCAI